MWDVKEKRTGQISVGLGYSARQRLVGRAELSETNFRGRGQAVNLLYEVGGFTGRSSVELGFFEPWLDKRHTSLSVDLYDKLVYRFSSRFRPVNTEDSDTYNERRKGGSVTVSRPLSEALRLSLGVRHDDVSTNDFIGTTFPTQNGSVTSSTVRGIQDTRDYATNPTGGSYNTLSLEVGNADVTETTTPTEGVVNRRDASSNFGKSVADLRHYWGLKKHKATTPLERQRERIPVVAGRLMFGMSSGTLPFFEHFFIGGADTIRGYVEDRFWGTRLVLFSGELRVPVSPNLIGVLFTDYGDAWNAQSGLGIENFTQHSSFRGNFGVGAGIRVSTPIGPIRLDYGIGREGGRAHFSIGHSF
jgi:outer membrane protein insertion porin family